jgi:hypothetical protein
MEFAVSVLPEISISPAPPAEPTQEPFSPFRSSHPTSPTPVPEDDGYRPSLLSPPPVISPRFLRQHSPLCPDTVRADPDGQGLEADQFKKLLASSRERNGPINGKRAPDLRKEIALKVAKNKQSMRLLLFF